MKKRILTLTLSILLALSTAACGTQSTAGNGTEQSAADGSAGDSSSQTAPDGSGTDDSGQTTPDGSSSTGSGVNTPGGSGTDIFDQDISGIFGMADGSLSFSSLTEFYNSELRTLLEDFVNELTSEATGLHSFITVEEPDILIYNYQYIVPLSSLGFSHEEAAAITASNLQETDYAAMAMETIQEFQSYGLTLRVVRMKYLDADGSLVYSMDYPEASDTSGLPGNSGLPDGSGTAPGIYADLQDWMDSSEDVRSTVEAANQTFASTGITFDMTVDGSVLVYQYYLPNDYFADGLAEEDMAAAFDSMVDAGSSSVNAIVSMFRDKYGLTVDAVRFAYYSKDGTELYSRDVRP